jgi:ketosteroid isomerase-like protein
MYRLPKQLTALAAAWAAVSLLQAHAAEQRSPAAETEKAAKATAEGVSAVLSRQADAWNRGDLDDFMKGYLRSAETSYTSEGKEVWGYEALQERYQKKYGAHKDTMGKLTFSDLRIFDVGKGGALCIGHWHLVRDKQPNLDGIFSLVLVDSKDGWKIIHDHTSTIK